MDRLTPQEKRILALLTKLMCDEAIADWCNISIKTMRTHKHSIYQKAGYRNLRDLLKDQTVPYKLFSNGGSK